MGTRHLTCVKHNGKYRVAQYGQWDGYPDGQGFTVLEFLRDKMDRPKFLAALSDCYEPTKEQFKQWWAEVGHDTDSSDGWVDCEISNKFKANRPSLDRDMGGKILEYIQDSTAPVPLKNSLNFAGDSLMCEYVWVVDFDTNTFEGFAGFNKTPLAASERFVLVPRDNTGPYYPVKLVAAWPLDQLPTNDDFLKRFSVSEDEESDEPVAIAS